MADLKILRDDLARAEARHADIVRELNNYRRAPNWLPSSLAALERRCFAAWDEINRINNEIAQAGEKPNG